MWSYRAWRRRRLLARHAIPDPLWRDCRAALPLLHRLSGEEEAHLRELALIFLHEKSFEATHGLVLDEAMKLTVAALASLPILHLGPDWLDDWVSVVLYPAEFLSDHHLHDEDGVVHHIREERAGESWERGPLILAWADVAASGALDGYNVVLHEIAHKLDGRDGALNGLPPLPRGLRVSEWSAAWGAAYDDLTARVERGEETLIDPYAAESPAEFFAVVSEAFFEVPEDILDSYPALYPLLRRFYRQDPAGLGGETAGGA